MLTRRAAAHNWARTGVHNAWHAGHMRTVARRARYLDTTAHHSVQGVCQEAVLPARLASSAVNTCLQRSPTRGAKEGSRENSTIACIPRVQMRTIGPHQRCSATRVCSEGFVGHRARWAPLYVGSIGAGSSGKIWTCPQEFKGRLIWTCAHESMGEDTRQVGVGTLTSLNTSLHHVDVCIYHVCWRTS